MSIKEPTALLVNSVRDYLPPTAVLGYLFQTTLLIQILECSSFHLAISNRFQEYLSHTPCSGGSRISRRGGRGPPMQVLFSENVCENKRIGSHRGWCAPGTPPLDPPMPCNLKLNWDNLACVMTSPQQQTQKSTKVTSQYSPYCSINTYWRYAYITCRRSNKYLRH